MNHDLTNLVGCVTLDTFSDPITSEWGIADFLEVYSFILVLSDNQGVFECVKMQSLYFDA